MFRVFVLKRIWEVKKDKAYCRISATLEKYQLFVLFFFLFRLYCFVIFYLDNVENLPLK